MTPQQTITNALSEMWTGAIREKFLSGTLIYERQLQAELYRLLKERLSVSYEIWVEPVIYLQEHNLNKVKPDIIITHEQSVVAVIELKFSPWKEADHKGDLDKLHLFTQAAKEQATIPLSWEPTHPNWEIQKQNIKTYSLDQNLLPVFMAVSTPAAYAVKQATWKEVQVPENLLHLAGWINENGWVDFQVTDKVNI